MSGLRPVGMTRAELADVLQDMAERVSAGDSFEGHIEYAIPDNPVGEVEVSAAYRIGNLQGQGGLRLIGVMS
jgi:hypothetical protein